MSESEYFVAVNARLDALEASQKEEPNAYVALMDAVNAARDSGDKAAFAAATAAVRHHYVNDKREYYPSR